MFFDCLIRLQNKDVGYVENQQQNIADAIDLLPRLTTGIDVNIKFRRCGFVFYFIFLIFSVTYGARFV